MAKSIIQTERECFLCGRTGVLHRHHCIEGSYRKLSEKYGLTVYLCPIHHMHAHESEAIMKFLRKKAQETAMHKYGWRLEEFIRIFGRSFL